MRTLLRPARAGLAALCGAGIGSCSGNAPTLPGLPELTGTITEAPIVGSPTEVYERVARGALACWFGAAGPLKSGYVYHAEADPPGKGGAAKIVIHERNRLADNPSGTSAYKISIASESETTTIVFENVKMPEPMAKSLEADARRWGAGGVGCAEAAAEGWADNDAAPAPPAKAEGRKRPKKGD